LFLSVSSFAFGLMALTIPAVLVYSNVERPSVSAKLETGDERTLEVSIDSAGIPANERVGVRIDKVEFAVDPSPGTPTSGTWIFLW
jgi:hypothetical protein